MTLDLHHERIQSQIPALQLLQNLGWTYLPPQEALRLRGGRKSEVLLFGVLEEQLRAINEIRHKGETYEFSESNLQDAVHGLRDIPFDGLVRTSEKVYDLLRLGRSLEQSIHGDKKSFNFRFIDWAHPERNAFHVTAEFEVERTGSHETIRPDIVLFVNGIPLAVIECKRADLKDSLEEGTSQTLRNQTNGYAPRLYTYAQILAVCHPNELRYATTGTPAKFWGAWQERGQDLDQLADLVGRSLTVEQAADLFATPEFADAQGHFADRDPRGRLVTEQDKALAALFTPGRLLELAERFIVYDGGEKKIARHQQYRCVTRTVERLRRLEHGVRTGGVVWHTQGSGKSLTMVMLADAIAREPGVQDHKILLVTDRVDLDDQIYRTFKRSGLEPVQASSGSHLVDLIAKPGSLVITAVLDKFDAALRKQSFRNESRDIFVLVDESHRSHYGSRHGRLKKALPNACYIGFTGTPVMKKDRNTVERFGGMIDTYTIREAVDDKAVVPLLYEGRDVPQYVDAEAVDRWFERVTDGLTAEQKRDLKQKFARADKLNQADKRIRAIAWDIAADFRKNWQGTGLKAQIVTPSKQAALRYKSALDEFGGIQAEVIISGPDQREGFADAHDDEPSGEIQRFWLRMMNKYGDEKAYNRTLIDAFKYADEPEILIVVDKLLTGFDAPRNTVLYITRRLRDHTLLQAIARVNRLHDGKDFGHIVDYYGVLAELGHALDLYGSLAEFEAADVAAYEGAVSDVADEIAKLPQRRADVWELFKTVADHSDLEAMEQHLAPRDVRETFAERVSLFARTLAVAMASVKFLETTPEADLAKYRRDLKFFLNLRRSASFRYQQEIDFKEYEARIQHLVDSHVGAGEVQQLVAPLDIFDMQAMEEALEYGRSPSSQADAIASATDKKLTILRDEDPALFARFSKMLEDAIAAFREGRLSDLEYLRQVKDIAAGVQHRGADDMPSSLRTRDGARAVYGLLGQILGRSMPGHVEAALAIDDIVSSPELCIVNWTRNVDAQNRMETAVEDFLFDWQSADGQKLTVDQIDELLVAVLKMAKARYAR